MGRKHKRSGLTRCSVEVDQSGKIEQTEGDTVLALANGQRYTVRIPAAVDRDIMGQLRRRYQPPKSEKVLVLRLFAAGLFLLLRDRLWTLDCIMLDIEYVGLDATIRGMLLTHIREIDPEYGSHHIIFGHVGKRSPAHDLALGVYRHEVAADHVVTQEELLNLL